MVDGFLFEQRSQGLGEAGRQQPPNWYQREYEMSHLVGARKASVQVYASVRLPARMIAAPGLMEVSGLHMKFQVLSRRERPSNKPLLIALHGMPWRGV